MRSRRKSGFIFLAGLEANMTDPDPSKRPTIEEVVIRYAEIRRMLSSWKLRQRGVRCDEFS